MPSFKEWALQHEDLLRVFHYNPETGVFVWQIDVSKCIKAGDTAGSPHCRGYRRIKVNGFEYLSHRLAFFYVTGSWPVDQIDHVNGEKSDNRWINLREATCQQNHRNRKVYANNTTGHKGVVFVKREGKFVARVKTNNKYRHLGYFDTAEAASAAYEIAAKEVSGEFYPDRLKVVV